jgi:hypothetical protein
MYACFRLGLRAFRGLRAAVKEKMSLASLDTE